MFEEIHRSDVLCYSVEKRAQRFKGTKIIAETEISILYIEFSTRGEKEKLPDAIYNSCGQNKFVFIIYLICFCFSLILFIYYSINFIIFYHLIKYTIIN